MSDIKAEIVDYWTDGEMVYATIAVPVELEHELRGQMVNLTVIEEEPEMMSLDSLLKNISDGNEHGWATEFEYLNRYHQRDMDLLMTSIQETGFRHPISIGPDNRIWDGHHRIFAAYQLGIEEVPVEWA